MSSPAAGFLCDALPPGAAVRLALFGKHPAAADHLEDMGLSTVSLVQFKQHFYVEGIGDMLARRKWEQEIETPEAVPYAHDLVCAGPAGWLLASLTASSDAKNRRQYPLVLAAHAGGFQSAAFAAEGAETLRQTLRQARAAGTMEELRAAHAGGQQMIESRLGSGGSTGALGRSVRERLLECCECQPGSDALARILHALAPDGSGSGRARVSAQGPLTALHALLLCSLVHAVTGQTAGVVWKHGEGLADISLGVPGVRALQGLFASESSLPPSAAIPYEIEDAARARWMQAVTEWLDAPALFPPPPAADDGGGFKGLLRGLFRGKHK